MAEFFEGAGQSEGLEVWRIEDMKPVKLPITQHGKFHEGDSYLVMNTQKRGWDIHFWIGNESSQDEYATAALMAVELDDMLGGAPIQHRECQGHESAMFKSYFKNIGLSIMKGGVKSGLHSVASDVPVKTLYQITGKKDYSFLQAPMNRSVINDEDCWVLDGGKGSSIFVYCPNTSAMKKFKVNNFACTIRDNEHAGSAEIVKLDELNDAFYEAMGEETDVSEDHASSDESEIEPTEPKLFRVSDATGEMEITEVATGRFEQEQLDVSVLGYKDCFILSSGGMNGIFAWIGKGATKEERGQAMASAEKFLKQLGLPKWAKVTRVICGSEPTVFKQYFSTWSEPDEVIMGTKKQVLVDILSEAEQNDADLDNIHASKEARSAKLMTRTGGALGFCPDDGTGEKTVWRVENLDLAPVPESAEGMLFGGDAYVIKYKYMENNRDKYIIYFWQGGECTNDEKAVSALKAMEMDDELGGAPVQVRVTQGSEPRHFLKMFGGQLVIHSGGKASGFKNLHDNDTYDVDGTRLFRVRGICEQDVRTVQIQPEKASSLDTDDAFILEYKDQNLWVWLGKGASTFERAAVQKVATRISPDKEAEVIEEGNEPDAFWEVLGGKGDYSKIIRKGPVLDPRLFHCYETLTTGNLRLIEKHDFDKNDLVTEDVMILDSGEEIYNWVGAGANEEETKKALELSKKYINSDPTPRNDTNTLIFTITEGNEPSSFTACFPSWT